MTTSRKHDRRKWIIRRKSIAQLQATLGPFVSVRPLYFARTFSTSILRRRARFFQAIDQGK